MVMGLKLLPPLRVSVPALRIAAWLMLRFPVRVIRPWLVSVPALRLGPPLMELLTPGDSRSCPLLVQVPPVQVRVAAGWVPSAVARVSPPVPAKFPPLIVAVPPGATVIVPEPVTVLLSR